MEALAGEVLQLRTKLDSLECAQHIGCGKWHTPCMKPSQPASAGAGLQPTLQPAKQPVFPATVLCDAAIQLSQFVFLRLHPAPASTSRSQQAVTGCEREVEQLAEEIRKARQFSRLVHASLLSHCCAPSRPPLLAYKSKRLRCNLPEPHIVCVRCCLFHLQMQARLGDENAAQQPAACSGRACPCAVPC